MTGTGPPFEPGRFFTTDPRRGALLDRNGDGVPDDARVRFALGDDLTAKDWIELVHLAARLGLETGGLIFPLAAGDAAASPAAALVLAYQPAAAGGRDAAPAMSWAEAAGGGPATLTVRGAAGLRALWREGLAGGAAAPEPAASPPPEPLDLAALYEPGMAGLLADDDGDHFPDRVRLCVVVPPRLPAEVGRALLDFAARLGLEATGLRWPLAVPRGMAPPPDTVPLLLAVAPDAPGDLPGGTPADLPALGPGEGLCAVVAAPAGGQALLIRGDAAGAARVLRELAATWPRLGGAAEPATAGDLRDTVVGLLRAEDATGRGALLSAALAARRPASGAAGRAELRLLDGDPALRGAAEAAVAANNLALAVVAAPDDRLAFREDWRDEWEVDRARRAVRERVLPALDRAAPAEILIMVSEPAAVRRALATELAALDLPAGSRVEVLSAFKPGLCWLREIVAPAWAARGDVARVELRYRPLRTAADASTPTLDLPIRWLQELYPADELLAAALGLPLDAVALVEAAPDAGEIYVAAAFDAAGREVDARAFSPRAYTRPYLEGFPAQGLVTATTGAVIARQGERVVWDEPLPTDLDRFWDYYQAAVLPRLRETILAETGGAPAAADQPFFDALDLEVWCSEPDEALGVREELLSSAEALHEDLYFATLDYVAALGAGAGPAGTLAEGASAAPFDAPGAIRPFVHVHPGRGPRARITLRRRLRRLAEIVERDERGTIVRRSSLAPLPVGPRPRARVTWALAAGGAPGFARLGLGVSGAGEEAAALLQRVDAAGADQPVVGLRVTLPERAAPVDLALPLPLPGQRPVRPLAGGADLAPPAVIDEEGLRPALARLAALPGVGVRQVGRSFEGRPIAALELVAPMGDAVWSRHKASLFKPTLLVVARHHANEPASTPAALHLAELCATDPVYRALLDRVNLALIPLENPDGAALHQVMQREHPTWKLHAARYNAAGCEFSRDFFNPDTPWGEARVRPALWRQWLPDVVVDNHGVPSHEWNQLFNGFNSPPRFGVSYWLVQALLYGILRYPADDPERAAFGAALRDRVAAEVAAEPDLLAANRLWRERYTTWGHARLPEKFPADYHREMLWFFGPLPPADGGTPAARPHQPPAYHRVTSATVVTEVADETAQGDYLALVARGHLVANRAILRLLAAAAPAVERAVATTAAGPRLTLRRRRPSPVPGGPPGAGAA